MEQSPQAEMQAAVADAEFCKPEANEMYYRFRNFLNTGQRTVVPDAGDQKPAPPMAGATTTAADSTAATGGQEITVGASVEIRGLQANTDLNGQAGIVLLFDPIAERYEVQLGDGQHKRIRAGNLKLVQESPKNRAGACHQESTSGLAAQPLHKVLGGSMPGGSGHMQGLQEGSELQLPGVRQVAQQVQDESGTAAGMHSARYLAVGGSEDDELDVTLQRCTSGSKTECMAREDTVAQASSKDLMPGARVLVHSLPARPDLTGKEGLIRGLDSTMDQWIVDIDGRDEKMQAANIQALSHGTGSKPSNSSLWLEIHSLTSASGILALCERQRTLLTPTDIVDALQQINTCTDCSLVRTTSRFEELLTHLRALLEEEATPADVVRVLSSLVEFNLKSWTLSQALATCALQHVDTFHPRTLARILMGFSELEYGDLQLFDRLARKLQGKATHLIASDCVGIACAFSSVRLCQFELLEELAEHVASQLGDLGEEQLVAGIEAFSALDVLHGALLEAAQGEAIQRAGRLSLRQLLRLASQSGRCGGEHWALARDALASAAGRLLLDTASVDFVEIARLADAFPGLRGRLEPRLRGCVRVAVASLRGFEPWGDSEARMAELRMACPDSIGIWGTKLALAEFGVSPSPRALVRRGLNRISWACTAVEDWTVQTVRKRSFAFAEYRFGVDEASSAEGNLVCHDGARPSEPLPALASALLSAGVVSLGEFCAFCWVLCDVYKLACETAGQAQADGSVKKTYPARRTQVDSMTGSLQVFAMEPPGLAGLLLVTRIQKAMPWLTLSVAVGAEIEAEMPTDEVLDIELDNEVLDVNLAEEAEVMEAVD